MLLGYWANLIVMFFFIFVFCILVVPITFSKTSASDWLQRFVRNDR